ncbi:uncharacterized protein LOC101240914 isoform X3 [Hydra vulgaris]|uniref:Uncharacterized protein LOC101240914 isoform X3 n=1 Tax=Hydra vulgaris TaxID=6087 RepID=A0ABM4BCI2_HYDVU
MLTKLMVSNLSLRSVLNVRRRLFAEQENNQRYVSSAQFNNEQASIFQVINILIVTTFEESGEIQLLSAHATYLNNNTNVLYCLPDDALQQCNQVSYRIIFTDVDLSRNNEMLRIITSIRKKCSKNKETPIIAVHQRHNNDDLDYYGVTDVYKGELNNTVVKEILDKYKLVFESTDLLEGNEDSESTSGKKTRDENILTASVPNSNIAGKKEEHYFSSQKSPSFVVSSSCLFSNGSSKVSLKSINKDYAPNHTRNLYRTPIPRNKTPKELHHMSYQPNINETMRKYPFIQPSHNLNPSYNIPYMVSGLPGSADMKITMMPDDVTKHSTKERLRRERIKECCDQMRDLLPRYSGHTRKIDMATVLELTVLYIRVIQMHSPAVVLDQCSQIFQNFCRQVTEKMKESEDSLVKEYTKSTKKSNDTKSSLLSMANLVYLNHNYPRCSEESVSPFTQYLRSNHFQPIEYLGIGIPTNNELYQQQLSHQTQYAVSTHLQKDHLFTDSSINSEQSVYGSHF